MKVFVARQPIFNRKEQVVAYELLYRTNEVNNYSAKNGDEATTDVMINSFFNIGMDRLTEGRKCFINFTYGLLKSDFLTYFDPNKLVIEILEDIPITKELIARCKQLKGLGYTIALDDFSISRSAEEKLLPVLFQSIDILKVDFLQTTQADRKRIVDLYQKYNIKFLAEKVESRKDYHQAMTDGFQLFQGYFFSEPQVVLGQDPSLHFHSYYQLLNELIKEQPSIHRVTHYIERDLSLSYQLLKLMNSPGFYRKNKITSIMHAIVMLGFTEIRRWIYILSFKNLHFKGTLKQKGSHQVVANQRKVM